MNTIDLEYIRSRYRIESKYYAATGGTATAAGPIMDMKTYRKVAFHLNVPTANTGGITKIEVIASASSNMASPAVVRAPSAYDSIDMDAADDQATIEVDHKLLAQLSAEAGLAVGSGYRYVQLRLTASNTDKVVITAIGIADQEKQDLTPKTTIA
jgi:hypothetical protein